MISPQPAEESAPHAASLADLEIEVGGSFSAASAPEVGRVSGIRRSAAPPLVSSIE